jgi:hypothetical protein
MVHAKKLCLLCLQHPLSVGCKVAGKGFCCPAEGCDRPHHATLHGVLKAGEPSPPEGKADPPGKPAASVDCGTPEAARQLRGLLEGLGIDPSALEERIGVRQPGEPGRPNGGGIPDPGATKAGAGRLTGRLMEALTSLCQAGERFVDSAAGSGQRMLGAGDPGEILRRRSRMIQSEPAVGGMSCTPGRNSEWMERQEPARREREDDIGMMGERRRALEDSEYVRGGKGSLERYAGLPRVVLLTDARRRPAHQHRDRQRLCVLRHQPENGGEIRGASQQASGACYGGWTGWPAGACDRTLHHGLPPGESCGGKAGHLRLRGGHAGRTL